MLIESIAFFLGISLLFYCLFGGADFGAAILEAFRGKHARAEQREVIAKAISPVWEANHVWLILAVVILFVGFPAVYSVVSIRLHIPLTLMLIGIILRGCAFTFRQYDPIKDDSQKYYSMFFVFSSFLTPLMLGIITGSIFLGRFEAAPSDFFGAYVGPWLNFFSFSVGLFTCVLFAFLAAVYLVGETSNQTVRSIFTARAKILSLMAIGAGCLVFAAGEASGMSLLAAFWSDPWALASVVLATILMGPLWHSILQQRLQLARALVAAQVALILLGWMKIQFPALFISRLNPEATLTIYNSAAPEATLRFLLYALLVGCVLIFPALFYLLIIFKRTEVISRAENR